MKRERHKIRELRQLVKLCGGKIPLPGSHYGRWKASVETGDATQWLKDNADHIICHARAVLWNELVAIHRGPDGFGWAQYDGNGTGIGCSMVNYPTEPAAMIVLLEEINE